MKALAAGLAALAACAHAQAPERSITMDPVVITSSGKPAPLEEKSEAQLFDDGAALLASGDFAGAAAHFDALLARFPSSAQTEAALYNAGLAHEKLGHFTESLDRFSTLLQRAPEGEHELEAQFHAALAEYKSGKREAAAARLHALSERPELPPARRGDALMQEAVCRFEMASPDDAEKLLRKAVQIFDNEMQGALLDPALPAQAEFWLGEVYRFRFREAALNPAAMEQEKLAEAMEAKAQLLLTAQGHYLRAIRRGQGEWATAAGFRIGELYEAFHDSLVSAPLPKGLDADQAQAYREALRERVRVLTGKAIEIYEQTLATAQRVGASSDYVEKTRQALQRVKRLLLDDQPTL